MNHIQEMIAAIPVERFPRIVEMHPAMQDCDTTSEYEHGLDLLLAGLRARLDRRRT